MKFTPLHIAALIELGLCWIAWWLAFLKPLKQAAGKQKTDRARSSWIGVIFEAAGFFCVWFVLRPADFSKSTPALVASMLLGPPAVALAWFATHHLAQQWRFEAALSDDHTLVNTGPYHYIRHPIYLSMLGMMLATAFAWTWWPMTLAGLVLFLIGTEIRVHAEEKLLMLRFGEAFWEYQANTRAYLPFIR
ncbi:MAG TPA: isoprenylcysteine carboxylmethyltransferase family protein [Terracidiphilus sp.]